MSKFKVGDLVRVKAKEGIAPGYYFKVGHIAYIHKHLSHSYVVAIPGGLFSFAEDELEKI